MTSLDQMKHVKSIKEAQPRDWKDIETRQCPLARIHVSDSNSLSNAKNPMQTRSYDSHPPLNSNPLNSNRKLLSDQFPACPVIFQTLQRNVPREDRDGLWILSDLPKHFSSGHPEIPSANQDLGPSIVSDVNMGVLLGCRAFWHSSFRLKIPFFCFPINKVSRSLFLDRSAVETLTTFRTGRSKTMTIFEHGMTCRVPNGQHTDRVEISALKWLEITGRLPAGNFVLPQLGVTPISFKGIKQGRLSHSS